ncbi:DUF2285 domain-containing protein [Hyphomicrobium sp. CS1BSMeth3]|uniref:DUF2285 domain-containing protein n=1 Tax=Hyphomicrobium sp. CS1BSMeth3 TaxID=1892844 RepID=UPI000930EA13|nr:DUF2285 domain-containing protein [Hyphomicrobium sp. CS1BSMeth3]
MDADTSAEIAPVFWHADALLQAIRVRAHPPSSGVGESIDVDLSELPALRRVLVDPNGIEHIVLQSGWASITLHNEGVSLVTAPACLTFLTEGVDRILTASRLLPLTRHLLNRPTTLRREQTQPAASWIERKHHALMALDARRNGATQREIATLMFGKAKTDAAWASNRAAIRQLVRRAIEHALELAEGGYRELLR